MKGMAIPEDWSAAYVADPTVTAEEGARIRRAVVDILFARGHEGSGTAAEAPPDAQKEGVAPSKATPAHEMDLTSPDQRVTSCPSPS
jgi:hypothetical protein